MDKELNPFFTYFWKPVLHGFVNKGILEVDKVEKVFRFFKKFPSKQVQIEDGWQSVANALATNVRIWPMTLKGGRQRRGN